MSKRLIYSIDDVPPLRESFFLGFQHYLTMFGSTVAIPLILILGVAYFSIFISNDHFEAIVTIQVTALLSAVALYLAIPKVASETATLSDKIFLVDYMAVSLMIATSILGANRWVRKIPFVPSLLGVVHVVAVPVMVGMMAMYVLQLSQGGADGAADLAEMAADIPPPDAARPDNGGNCPPLVDRIRVTEIDVSPASIDLTNSDYFALNRFFSSGVGDDDAAGRGCFLSQSFYDHTIVQWANLHFEYTPMSVN